MLFKTVKVIKDREILRNCHSQEESKERDDQVQCGILDGTLKERILGKTNSE